MPYMTFQEIEKFDFTVDKTLLQDDSEVLGQMMKQKIALKMGTGAALGVQGRGKNQMSNVDNLQDGEVIGAQEFGQVEDD